jgi:hypothetical protein
MVHRGSVHIQEGACGTTGGSNRALSRQFGIPPRRYWCFPILATHKIAHVSFAWISKCIRPGNFLNFAIICALLKPVQRLELLELDFSDDGLNGAQWWNVWNG